MIIFNELIHILRCVECSGRSLRYDASKPALLCADCGRVFAVNTDDGIIDMFPKNPKKLPDSYNNPHYRAWQDVSSDALSGYFENNNFIFNAIHHSVHKNLARFSQKKKTGGWILDLGCGTGAHYPYYENVESVIGIDMNMDSLKKIKERYPRVILIRGDCYNLPLADLAVSEIYSVYNLEHLWYLEDAICEARRVLEKGGFFFAGLPCEGGLLWNMGRKFTSEKAMSKKYNIDYKQVIALEHCNTAEKITRFLKEKFIIDEMRYFPLRFIPSTHANLTIAMMLHKE